MENQNLSTPSQPIQPPKISNNLPKTILLMILVIMLLIIAALGIKMFILNSKQIQLTNNQITNNTVTPTLKVTQTEITPTTVSQKTFPIKLLDNKTPDTLQIFIEGKPAPVQPEFFDPKTTKFEKNKYIDKGKSMGFYSQNMTNYFKITPYSFSSGGSSFSYVIDLEKNDKRQALYTQINKYYLSNDNKYLFLANNLKKPDGKWQALKRIIDLENNKSITLPQMDCVSSQAEWDQNKLITYFDFNYLSENYWKSKNSSPMTQFCIWDKQGNLLNKLEADLYWPAASANFLNAQFGLLPKDPNIFWVYAGDIEVQFGDSFTQCKLYLQDLTKTSRQKTMKLTPLADGKDYCSYQKIDISNITF